MSLINEALKKAQRMRNEGAADPTAAAATSTPGVRITKRSKAPAANTMVLVGSGALVLVVLSVVVTVYLLNRPSTPAAAPRTASATPPPAATPKIEPTTSTSSTPPVVAPTLTPPTSGSSSATPPTSVATSSPSSASPAAATPAMSTSPGSETTPATATSTPTPAPAVAQTPAAPPPTPKPDERVSQFVEAIRVTGIRSSGNESRVLMNDRVFRVNDIVDRTLNIKLVKVAADTLTFSDANGVTYDKHF